MKDNSCLSEKPQVAHEILSYLAEHPESNDTLEGIVHWWLLEQRIKNQTAIVKEAIAELVDRGLVLEHKVGDLQSHYRINPHKSFEIQSLIESAPE